MAKVILIRHGHTNLNHIDKEIDRVRGWLDIPLNSDGLADAEKDAQALKDTPYSLIYSSDLKRAVQTAIIINKLHHKDIYTTSSLRPWHLGIYEAGISSQVVPMLKYYQVHETEMPKDGESFKVFRLRFLMALDEIMRQAKEQDSIIIVTTHFRNLQTAQAWINKGKPSDYSVDIPTLQSDEFKPGAMLEVPLH
jgi:2,3-bisphosphoglycerate-dependent phosphoglycerate mutase